MKGLKTQETHKFVEFFTLVQNEANSLDCVFFLEAGDGRDFETPDMEGEDLQGWLIPKNKADEFQKQWEKDELSDTWDEYFGFAIWEESNDTIKITFK